MNLVLLNAITTKQVVIKNTFPMKVTPKIIPSTQPTSKSFPNFKIIPPTYVTYEIKPTASLKNDKVGLLLDTITDSYTELFQVGNQFRWTDQGIKLPMQNKLFFETRITNKEYKSYVSMLENKEQETLQTLNFTWHKSAKVKVDNPLFSLDKNCIGFEFKLKHTTGLSLSVDQRLKEKPIRELLEQSNLLKDTEQIFIQFGLQPAEMDWWKEADKRVKSISKRVRVTETTTYKLGCPAFDCSLRIVFKGENIQRSEMLSRGTIMALKQLNGDNELVETRIKQKKLKKWFDKCVINRKIESHFFRFSKRFLLTRKEIRHFIKLPERTLQVDFELGVSEREELKVDSLLRKKDGILIGHTEDKGKKVEIRIPKDNDDSLFNMNIYFGSPRVGKDVAQTNFIIESCLHANCGAIVPDVINEPVRGMADMLRDYLPKDRIVDVDFCNVNHSIYLGFEDIIHEVGVDLLSNDVVKILELDDKFDSKQLCRMVAKATNCNLYDMHSFLSSDIYAQKVYQNLKDKNELLALELQHKYFDKNMSSSGKAQAKKAVLTRLDDFISIDKIKYMFAQKPNNQFDLMTLMSQNKVVIIRMLKTGGLGELACRTIMHLLTTKVFWLKKIMLTKSIPSRTFIVFNEFHQFLTKGFEELLTDMMFEAPKYKLGMLMSLHNPSKISSTLWSMMQSASATMYLFKNTNYQVYRDLEAQLKPINLETAKDTQRFESIMIPYVEGKQLQPLFVRMITPPIMRIKKQDNENVGIECQEKYGTSVQEIMSYIMDREINLYKESA